MKRILALILSLLFIFSLTACAGGKSGNGKSTTPAYSTPAVEMDSSDALKDFFGGDPEKRISDLSGIVYSFACAVQVYPEVLTSLPGLDFGWAYLYNLLVYNGVTTDGVSVKSNSIQATEAALETLQFDTLGGALWEGVSPDWSDFVEYNEDGKFYTIKTDRPQQYCAYIESVTYREDAACAELLVAICDTSLSSELDQAIVAQYYIDLRAHEDSPYGYIIAAFSSAD